jgi:hypothetical protein
LQGAFHLRSLHHQLVSELRKLDEVISANVANNKSTSDSEIEPVTKKSVSIFVYLRFRGLRTITPRKNYWYLDFSRWLRNQIHDQLGPGWLFACRQPEVLRPQ